jgi:hypothetical protein
MIGKGRMVYSCYYQAYVNKSNTWLVVATLRSYEHVAFDRTLDADTALFEFFVPPSNKELFLALMAHFEKAGLVTHLRELPNRLQYSL